MSVRYVAVQWSAHKRVYDWTVVACVGLYLGIFVLSGALLWRGVEALSPPVLLMRALGSCAFLMLHVVLCIGPLARLDRRWLPLLYNRRHLGVATFVVAALHGLLALGFYHGFGVWNPLVSLLVSNTGFGSLRTFPFQPLGAAALVILMLMAATSHDFWNRRLGPRGWKSLHMSVYVAYALLVAHVALGALQTGRGAGLAIVVAAGAGLVVTLHLVAALAPARDVLHALPSPDGMASGDPAAAGWVDVCGVEQVRPDRARIVAVPGGERIAVFRHQDGYSAITNVCAHQGGPLGAGKVVDGCVTCPWHGWQYRPADGCAPPPFSERIATYDVRIRDGRVQVNPRPNPAGTRVEPARVQETEP